MQRLLRRSFLTVALRNHRISRDATSLSFKYAIQTQLHHWTSKFNPPQYLVTDRGIEYLNQDIAHLCSPFNFNHSPRTPYSPWINGSVEVQIRNLGLHLRLVLQNHPTNWSFQTQMYAYAHNTTSLSQFKLPHIKLISLHPRIPITFSLNLLCDASKNCMVTGKLIRSINIPQFHNQSLFLLLSMNVVNTLILILHFIFQNFVHTLNLNLPFHLQNS